VRDAGTQSIGGGIQNSNCGRKTNLISLAGRAGIGREHRTTIVVIIIAGVLAWMQHDQLPFGG
jgi:hypothetical protein